MARCYPKCYLPPALPVFSRGLLHSQTPRKLEQSRGQVTLRVTPPESVTDWQSLSAAHGPRSPSRSCGRRSDQSDPHGASRLSGDPLSRTPKDRQSPRNRTAPPLLSEWDPLVIARSPSGALGVQPARSEPRRTASAFFWGAASSDHIHRTFANAVVSAHSNSLIGSGLSRM